MNDLKSGAGPSRKGRNAKGQYEKGASGNPNGRPRKKEVKPRSYEQTLADAWAEEVPTTNAQGEQEMVPAFEAYIRQQVRSIPTMNPREQRAALKSLEDLGKTMEILQRRGAVSQPLTREQLEERVMAHLARLKQRKASNG